MSLSSVLLALLQLHFCTLLAPVSALSVSAGASVALGFGSSEGFTSGDDSAREGEADAEEDGDGGDDFGRAYSLRDQEAEAETFEVFFTQDDSVILSDP